MSGFTDAQYERVDEARNVLEMLGMAPEQSNERSALVLLALLQLEPVRPWSVSSNPMLGTRALMDFVRDHYGRDYKPNSRETVRRFTLHQFVEAHLVVENADDPSRPINSPKWNYRINNDALELLRQYGSATWESSLDQYTSELPGNKTLYAAARKMNQTPMRLLIGTEFTLTPGGQNDLFRSIIEEFCPRFLPGGIVLYLGDAGAKLAHFERDALLRLGVIVDEHGKMPDIVVFDPVRNWLVLIEAASSHGPVDEKGQIELAKLFGNSSAGLVYVSCFPTRTEFRKYVTKIAWESDVWCADHPSHLIHYNGDRFLAPR